MILQSFLKSHEHNEHKVYGTKQKQMPSEHKLFNKSRTLFACILYNSTSCNIWGFSLGTPGFTKEHISLTWYTETRTTLNLAACHQLASLKIVETSGSCHVKFDLVNMWPLCGRDCYAMVALWYHRGMGGGLWRKSESKRAEENL